MATYNNYYDVLFKRSTESGASGNDAALTVINAYLDGKPAKAKKQSLNRDELFWTGEFIFSLNAETVSSELFILALARYFAQRQIQVQPLLPCLLQLSPEAVIRAFRYSGMVLNQSSEHWLELKELVNQYPDELGDLIHVSQAIQKAHRDRLNLVEQSQKKLAQLTPFELLSYASLFSFQHYMSGKTLEGMDGSEIDQELAWKIIRNILVSTLKTSEPTDIRLSEPEIGKSLKQHLSPLLFPSDVDNSVPKANYEAFGQLFLVQAELDDFLNRTVDAFSYSDDIRFEPDGDLFKIVQIKPESRKKWQTDGKKLLKVHGYWFKKGLRTFVSSGMAEAQIGSPENQEGNQFAYINALAIFLKLQEVYGVSERVAMGKGRYVDLFQALLSVELMTAFYQVVPKKQGGDWDLGFA